VDKSRLGAGRPVRSWGIEAPRNSLKTPENSQKSSQSQRPGSPAAQDAQRAQQSNSETPVKKLRFLPFLFLSHRFTHRARAGSSRATFGIKSAENREKFLPSILTCQEAGVYTYQAGIQMSILKI
jgi:hypothetical protein